MDLKTWIDTDHASIATRFESAIVGHVTQRHWKSHSDGGSSIAWLVFHMTYHHDLALNTAIRNHPPLLAEHRDAIGLGRFDPSAGLSESEDREVTAALRLDELRTYVDAVDAGAQAWIDHISIMALDSIPEASWRLEHKAGIPADGPLSWLHAMWAGKTVAWFVQWECIGHRHAHVGEMVGVRNRLGLSPF